MTLHPPELAHLCDLAVTIAALVERGHTPAGLRRTIPITGGTVKGPQLNGCILPGGADFQLILGADTQAHLDARHVIELNDGSRVFAKHRLARGLSGQFATHHEWPTRRPRRSVLSLQTQARSHRTPMGLAERKPIYRHGTAHT